MSDENKDITSLGGESDYVTLRPGQTVGRYRIVSVLGQGGFGITYRATDSELGREVALKEYLPAALAIRQDGTTVVPRSTAAAQDFSWGRDRFIAEGRTLAALHRVPGIVLVHDFIEANGTAYLIMELLAGNTLQERIQRQGALDAAAVGRILSTLLAGLEQVHNAGFLHRDIKPANILLDSAGNPTLIDFGASRAAIAGRSTALTAIFTPGYAAAEQMTSASQGPWTDIYGLSATLYHAISGKVPPTAFDRMLDDAYEPLARLKPPGFGRGLLAGLDAGLALRASDRPQSIAGWRPILRQDAAAEGEATVSMAHAVAPQPAIAAQSSPATPAAAGGRRVAVWIGAVTAILLLAAGAFYSLLDDRHASPSSAAANPVARAAEDAKFAAEAQRLKDQEELVRLRTEAAAREKAEQEAAQRREIEEETRRKVEAEMAGKQRQQEAARQKAEAEAAAEARRQAETKAAAQKQAEEDVARRAEAGAAAQQKAEADRKVAEAAEAALGITHADRQRIQFALAAVGFPPGVSHGVFGPRTREMLAAWQRKTGRAATGYLTADAQRELLREVPPPQEQPPTVKGAGQPAQEQAVTRGAVQCEGTFNSQWCRGAYQGFPSSCWQVPMTIRNRTISGSWTSRGSTEAQSFNGGIGSGGEVLITYHGIGEQTFVNQRFTVAMTGRVADGILTAAGRSGPNGRDFSIRVQCR